MADKSKKTSRELRRQQGVLCDKLSFSAAEAYKLLRTNLLFAMPDKSCRVLGVSSAVRGEGKSTTAINLSYTLAETGKRVLLIDADMRLPSVAGRLEIDSAPGLSNLLAGMSSLQDVLVTSRYFANWYIMPAGDLPPNPSELLSSEAMHGFLERASEIFDFIIFDLPPVNIVSDALAISPVIDGLILVVRQNYTDRRALDACMYHVAKLDTKFLGFVTTGVNSGESGYRRYGRYGGYKYGYGYGYGYGYAAGQRRAAGSGDKPASGSDGSGKA